MFAVLYLPQFPLQAALRPAPELWARPIALVDPMLNTPRICDLTKLARREGVELGQTPTQALARCREVVIRHRSVAQETAATDAILQCAYGFSPSIESTAPGVVTLDLRGLSELSDERTQAATSTEVMAAGRAMVSPSLRRWAGRLQTALMSLHLTARVGLGPTPNMARHAAQWGGELESASPAKNASGETDGAALPDTLKLSAPCIVTDAPAFIAALPVAALAPSTDVANILQKWGVRTVGQLLALGQDAVMDWLGLEAIALFAAAAPQTTRPLNLIRPAERYAESFDFEHAVETVEPLLFILNRFVDQICQRLEIGLLAAEQLTLRLGLASGENLEQRLRVPQPTRRAEVLFRMLQTHLEQVRTDSPIVSVALQADPTRPGQMQFSLFEAALRDPYQFQETLARLSALVGAERIGTPVRENSHRPDAFKLIPPDFDHGSANLPLRRRVAEILRQTPLRRLRPAMPATVDQPLPDESTGPRNAGGSAPLSLRCQLARGQITLAVGPWRASGHWWEAGMWARDEWDVQTQDGQVLRLVRSGELWHVEAMLD